MKEGKTHYPGNSIYYVLKTFIDKDFKASTLISSMQSYFQEKK